MSCCGRQNRMPGFQQQVKNLTLSAANIFAYAATTGKLRAEPQVVNTRVELCKACRHLQETRCIVCGCFISLKAGFVAEKCPIGKW